MKVIELFKNQEECYNDIITDEEYNEFVLPELIKYENKVYLEKLKTMNNMLFELYESDPEYLVVLFKNLYIQFKKKEKVDSMVNPEDKTEYWNALNLYYYLKNKKRKSHTIAFNCAKKELEKHNIETDNLFGIIQAFNSFRKIKL